MNTQELEKLLGKYYNGETTDGEEELLRIHFRTSVPPEGLEHVGEIFSYYDERGEIPSPSAGLGERIISAIDKDELRTASHKRNRIIYGLMTAAASAAILIGLFSVLKNEPADTFSDPAIAYAEAMKVLYSVSSTLNSGVDALKPVSEIENAASFSISKISGSVSLLESGIKPMSYLQRAMNLIYSPIDEIRREK